MRPSPPSQSSSFPLHPSYTVALCPLLSLTCLGPERIANEHKRIAQETLVAARKDVEAIVSCTCSPTPRSVPRERLRGIKLTPAQLERYHHAVIVTHKTAMSVLLSLFSPAPRLPAHQHSNDAYAHLLSGLAAQDEILAGLWRELIPLDKEVQGTIEGFVRHLEETVDGAIKVGKGCRVTMTKAIAGESVEEREKGGGRC